MAKKESIDMIDPIFLYNLISFISEASRIIPAEVQRKLIKNKCTIEDLSREYEKYRDLDKKDVN